MVFSSLLQSTRLSHVWRDGSVAILLWNFTFGFVLNMWLMQLCLTFDFVYFSDVRCSQLQLVCVHIVLDCNLC